MLIALLILLLIIVVPVIWGVSAYNGLVGMRNKVEEAWAQIDTELKRRHDLIGNLVETVKGYAAHERGTLEDVMKARSAAMAGGQSPAEQAHSEGALTQAVGRLFAVAEAYPDLKANQNFMALQNELTNTEDRIASSRRYYNATVKEYMTKTQTVPTNLIANTFNFEKKEYFEAVGTERDAVQVDFGQRSATIPPPQSYTGSEVAPTPHVGSDPVRDHPGEGSASTESSEPQPKPGN